jgi:hypothetical protein
LFGIILLPLIARHHIVLVALAEEGALLEIALPLSLDGEEAFLPLNDTFCKRFFSARLVLNFFELCLVAILRIGWQLTALILQTNQRLILLLNLIVH